MSKTRYSIVKWGTFEVSQATRNKLAWAWVPIPTKHDGRGFKRVMQAGPEIYAAWILIIQVAAKMPVRGVLSDDIGPLDSKDLELKTGCPAELFDRALKLLQDPQINWIKAEECQTSDYHLTALGALSESALLSYPIQSKLIETTSSKVRGQNWVEVEGVLRGLGIARAKDLVIQTGHNGLTESEVLSYVDVYRAHINRWDGPGALYSRLQVAGAGQNPSDLGLWPRAKKGYLQREQAGKRAAKQTEQKGKLKAECDHAKSEAAELESMFGPTLDAMPADQLESLVDRAIGGHAPTLALYRTAGKSAKLVRAALLEALREQASRPP